EFSKFKGYDVVKLGTCGTTGKIGEPALPVVSLSFLIPPSASVTKVEVIDYEKEDIAGEYNILPAQHPIPFIDDFEPPPFVEPKPEVYSSTQSYPGKVVEFPYTGTMSGYRIGGVIVYPLQYMPVVKKLNLYTKIELCITYKEGVCPVSAKSMRQNEVFGDILKGIVVNHEDIARFTPSISKAGANTEYVIITDTTKVGSYFGTLVSWKESRPVRPISAKLVDLSWIKAHAGVEYGTGRDLAETIRNFIKYAHENWGTIWVLLGGDVDLIPCRIANCHLLLSYGGDIPSDLYFSDLDGDWDADKNGEFGDEEGDLAPDMYPDVFVGRASVSIPEECTTFVNKVLTYEGSRPSDYVKKELLIGEHLFVGIWGRIVNDSIATITPPDYTITKLYESLGNVNKEAVINHINSGYHFIHHAAHGNTNVISTGPDRLDTTDVDNLTNGDLLSIYVAISCMVGAFDWGNCIVEHFMNNPNGGTVAWVGNSRYGWGHFLDLDHQRG
ncbi:MAG: C25 family cysteine peptidase, partial [bacterium]|nr:C25 family cysteine peptidase [bacterium]